MARGGRGATRGGKRAAAAYGLCLYGLAHKPLFPRELEEARCGQRSSALRVSRANMSSMLFDVRQGRPTEIEYLNGYLMKLGAQYDAGMLVTQSLYNLIKMRSSTIPQLHPV
ncbi:hypothetical protein A0H81_01219 [Grifola frondosa]|uniref:Ketopantoate reductase C-terminal domain-containing protein n=1 Tax=Grifola frondosa TaxID=5627 RepID=A0A1C7MUN5_GRIFR|nr:hypothetical protein A0H81_01219 [Grifola frondosa]